MAGQSYIELFLLGLLLAAIHFVLLYSNYCPYSFVAKSFQSSRYFLLCFAFCSQTSSGPGHFLNLSHINFAAVTAEMSAFLEPPLFCGTRMGAMFNGLPHGSKRVSPPPFGP